MTESRYLQIPTEAVYEQMSHFYEVCSHKIAFLSPVWPQTTMSDKQLSSLTPQVPLKNAKILNTPPLMG